MKGIPSHSKRDAIAMIVQALPKLQNCGEILDSYARNMVPYNVVNSFKLQRYQDLNSELPYSLFAGQCCGHTPQDFISFVFDINII